MTSYHHHGDRMSRRKLVGLLAGAGTMLPVAKLIAATERRFQPFKRGRIDVHHHMLPSFHFPDRNWEPQTSLDVMDKHGTDVAILSFVIPGEELYDGSEKSKALVRKVNDFGAQAAIDHPGRFGLFASLPLREPEASLKEIEYVFDVLKCEGVVVLSNAGDRWLGDPLFAPVFDELNKRKAVVFIHPARCSCWTQVPGMAGSVLENDFDTTRAVTDLLFSGTLARCQDIKWIVNHSGACVPTLAGRIKDRVPGVESSQGRGAGDGKSDKTPNGVFFELQRLYYECAHASYPAPMAALRAFAPPTQYLFGTDYPVEPYETTVDQLPFLDLPPDVQYALNRGNAERLWPQFK